MKRSWILLFVLLIGGLCVAAAVHAQTCTNTKPTKAPYSDLKFTSSAGTATLCGFEAFVSPDPVPKKYRTKTQSGSMYICEYTSPNCSLATPYQWSGGGVYTDAPGRYAAALYPVAVRSDGMILYHASIGVTYVPQAKSFAASTGGPYIMNGTITRLNATTLQINASIVYQGPPPDHGQTGLFDVTWKGTNQTNTQHFLKTTLFAQFGGGTFSDTKTLSPGTDQFGVSVGWWGDDHNIISGMTFDPLPFGDMILIRPSGINDRFTNGQEKWIDPNLGAGQLWIRDNGNPNVYVSDIHPGAITATRDDWNKVDTYDPATCIVTSTDTSLRFQEIGLNVSCPLVSGGSTITQVPTSYSSQFVTTTTQPTRIILQGNGNCVNNGNRSSTYSTAGSVTTQLSNEDTEKDAEARAAISAGASATAFRTKRTTGFSFQFQDTKVDTDFNITCPGQYIARLRYTTSPHGSNGAGIEHVYEEVKTFDSGQQHVTFTVKVDPADALFNQYNTDYTITGVELQSLAGCSQIDPGGSTATQSSIHIKLGLGRTTGDVAAGQISLDSEVMSALVYSPAALSVALSAGNGTTLVRDSNGAPRQISASQTFADIATLDANSYEVRFYTPSQVGVQNTLTHLYAVTGDPYVVYKLENPDAAQNQVRRLRMTETRGSMIKITEFGYDSTASTWSLTQLDGARNESEVITTVNGDSVRTWTVRDASNHVVSKRTETYHAFPWGEEMIREVLDPDGAALTTQYDFYDSVPTTDGNYGHLKQRTNANGSWERYTYDSAHRVLKVISPFLNAPPATVDESSCRVVETTYDSIADLDGDGLNELRTTTVERVLGQETSRRYRIDWSKPMTFGGNACTRRTESVCIVSGSNWDASGNLITERLRYADGVWIYRDARVVNPDGTATITTFVANNGQVTTTSASGQPNSDATNIVDGTRTVSISSGSGQVVSETTTDVVSGLVLSTWAASAFDSAGRPTRLDYDDGTYETRTYACCGLASQRDRSGIVTNYDYDGLGRRISVSRAGLTTRTAYDADGRILTITRVGTDATAIVLETNTYDLAGRLVTRADALNRTTTFSEAFDSSSGRTTRTTTNPDGSTSIEVSARDGSVMSVTGTATAPHNFEYGVDATGSFIKDIAVGQDGDGQPTATEWMKNYTDFAGRALKTVYADSAAAQSYYNSFGQLSRQVDPDGVTTLYAYNARGEREVTAIDVDGNGAIDYMGIDRVTKSTTVAATRTEGSTSYIVRRTTTQVWATNNQDSATTISSVDEGVDGSHTWQTTQGLTTAIAKVLDGSGGWTITTTTPDGVKSVQTFDNGRLTSSVVETAADVQIAATTYAYDAHGRTSTTTDARNGSTTYAYFADDQVQSVTTPDPDPARSGNGYDAQTTTYTYDTAGRIATIAAADGGVVTTTYWPTGAVKRTSGARTYPVEYAYDPQGRIKTLTTWQNFAGDSGKAVTTWNYDSARGFFVNKRYADNTGPAYTYTSAGRLLTRTWARGITTTYAYNGAGDLASSSYSNGDPSVSLTYDRLGRLITKTDGIGACSYTYQGLSLLIAAETHTSGLLSGLALARTYDGLLRLSNVSSALQSTGLSSASYTYDAASRLGTVTSGANTATYSYVSNSALVSSIVFANQGTQRLATTKTYDYLNRLASMSSQTSSGATIGYTYTHNAANQRTRATHEDGTYWAYNYDSLGQVTAGKAFLANDTAKLGHDYAWSYDDIGNRKTEIVNSQTTNYVATSLNQYSSRSVPTSLDVLGGATVGSTVTVAVNNGSPQLTTRQGEIFFKQVAVDNTAAAQNVTLKTTGVKNQVGPNGEDAMTQIAQSAFVAKTPETFTYDLDGNLTDDARWHYTWDAENRLIAMETSVTAEAAGVTKQKLEFAYDAQSRRISKKVSNWDGTGWTLAASTLFIYDGWNMLAELNALAGNAVVRTYVWGLDLSGSLRGASGIGGLLFFCKPTDTYSVICDGSGNITGLVGSTTDTIAGRCDYDLFGHVVRRVGVADNPFGFSSKYVDVETDNIYYGNRCYTPEGGRWLSRDPIEEQGGENLYGFVGNRPTNAVDPNGLWLEIVVPKAAPFVETIKPIIEAAEPIQQVAKPTYPSPLPNPGQYPISGPQFGGHVKKTWKISGEEYSNPEDWLFRSMSGDILPDVGESATKLGVRPGQAEGEGVDVVVISGFVSPENPSGKIQGMSTAPRSPYLLFGIRKPKEFGGTSNKPAWAIRRSSVLMDPKLIINDDSSTHSTVAPSRCMQYPEYRNALEMTRPFWRKVIVITEFEPPTA